MNTGVQAKILWVDDEISEISQVPRETTSRQHAEAETEIIMFWSSHREQYRSLPTIQ